MNESICSCPLKKMGGYRRTQTRKGTPTSSTFSTITCALKKFQEFSPFDKQHMRCLQLSRNLRIGSKLNMIVEVEVEVEVEAFPTFEILMFQIF